MADLRLFAATSNLERFTLKSSVTGQGLTGLSSASSGLIISTAVDNAATAVTYAQAGSTIEAVTTLGTYAAPTATKCRFKEFDPTNHPGLYEFQFADARYAVASSRKLVISVSGAANLLNADYEIALIQANLYDAVRLGLTALPNAAAGATGGLYILGQLFLKKNTALSNFEFPMFLATDHVTPATGLTVTATRSIDGGAFAACANAVSEVGSGVYKINLAAADMNGRVITLLFTAATADARYLTVVTQD